MVTVSAAQSCPATSSVTLAEPARLDHQLVTNNPFCDFANGEVTLQVSGGVPPYNYNWNPSVATGTSSSSLSPGTYRIIISDANSCKDTADFDLINQNLLNVFLGNDTMICPGQQLILDPGIHDSYLWQDNSSFQTYTVMQSGDYWVTVADNNGCTASDTIKIDVNCPEVYFPSAFTPNNDGKNDLIGPLGNLNSVKDYSVSVFDRWREMVFHSANPFEKWNGFVKGKKADNGIFVWHATFSLQGKPKESRKGTITLIK
jgi:gliding motility-associated-like protein